MSNPLLDIALSHHVDGRVLIAVTKDKKPYREGWNEYFTRRQTEAEVREHFGNGAFGIAMVLYPACNYVVLDFDGPHAQAAWHSTGIELPETARNTTRSGGVHLLFKMPAGELPDLKRKVRLVKAACDCKGPEGKPKPCGVDLLIHGYAVMPPTPGYTEDPDFPLESAVPIPREILTLVQQQPRNENRVTGNAEGLIQRGERKATLVSLAGTLHSRGMSIESIRAALEKDNQVRCVPPLEQTHIDDILKSAAKWEQGKPPADPTAEKKPERSPVTVRISDVEREEVKWLWDNRVPLKKLTILEGDPGVGKSQLTLAIAAPISKGLPIFGDEERGTPATVLILSAEDGIADTIRPRLEDMGADISKVFALTAMIDESGSERTVTLADLDILEAAITKHKPELVIVDPIIAFTAGADTHKANEVRGILAALAALAERHGCAVIAVRHLNKGNGRAIYRGQGSIDFLAACRSAFLVGENPDNPAEKVLVHTKSNLGPKMPSLTFSIEEGRFLWGGETSVTADQILAAPTNSDEKSQVDEAGDFLEKTLESGAVDSKKIMNDARHNGISERTLWRAKKKLNIQAVKEGFESPWKWELSPKSANLPPKSAKSDRVANVADFDESWQPSANSLADDGFEVVPK